MILVFNLAYDSSHDYIGSKGLFSSRKILGNAIVDLKDSFREFRLNCIISFIFYLYLMLLYVFKVSM
jgi:hypothetical protein